MSKLQKVLIAMAALLALLIPPFCVAYIALSHNPQNEFSDEHGRISWDLLAYAALPALVPGAFLAILVTVTLLVAIKIVNPPKPPKG